MERLLELLSINEDDATTVSEMAESLNLKAIEVQRLLKQMKLAEIPVMKCENGYYLSYPVKLYNNKYIRIEMPCKRNFDLIVGDKIAAICQWFDNPYRTKKVVTVTDISNDVFICETDKGVRCAFQKKDYEYSFVNKA